MYWLFARFYKKRFIDEFKKIESKYRNKYKQEKNPKFKKLWNRKPYRDLSRNKYMLEIPNFSKTLKEFLVPLLQNAKEYLKKCLNIMKGECIFMENNINIEDILMDLAEICILLREYRPRVTYKYVDLSELQK